MKTPLRIFLAFCILSLLLSACVASGYWVPPRSSPTATPEALAFLSDTPVTSLNQTSPSPTPPQPTDPPFVPLPSPTPMVEVPTDTPLIYYAQAADTLRTVAIRFGVEPDEIQAPNEAQPLPLNTVLNPGELLLIPDRLVNTTSSQQLMPDSEVVYSPSATDFDIAAYVQAAGGKLSTYSQWLQSSRTTSGADLILRAAIENSINPRLLVSLLEYHSGWVTGQPETLAQDQYPMGYINLQEKGLFNQLVWTVNQLSIGYYAYREGRLTEIHFKDGSAARLAPDLNAGTAALQYYFAQLYSGQQWLDALNPDTGFPALHAQMFGSPWERAVRVEPLYPPGLVQPPLTLPFDRNKMWSFTGGPHGAWEHDGAYAALDFAPGSSEPGCIKSYAWVLAAASGLVVREGPGVVVLDLDGDGSEQTGWVLLYLHVSSQQRIPLGSWVDAGDRLGHPSCEGGVSTGTHVHIARKYNGEWIPADGPMPFNLGGWVAEAGSEAYKGKLVRGDDTVTACTCASAQTFIMRSDDDP